MGYRTHLQSLDRYNRTVGRSAERNAKRQLPVQDSQSRPDTKGAELLLHLSATPQTPTDKENSAKGKQHDLCIKLNGARPCSA
ncbi:hypothetical protein MAR_032041 [Mya arenaria]|uniref:Uncharacterized protein n=1 Tax=Mya arenaria TaxID=6604 RepID=A0ABY7F749_MYAAR|nr:hypothetical protein MAR_032041 [Mya arenaria]